MIEISDRYLYRWDVTLPLGPVPFLGLGLLNASLWTDARCYLF
jgi:hypothetical protein